MAFSAHHSKVLYSEYLRIRSLTLIINKTVLLLLLLPKLRIVLWLERTSYGFHSFTMMAYENCWWCHCQLCSFCFSMPLLPSSSGRQWLLTVFTRGVWVLRMSNVHRMQIILIFDCEYRFESRIKQTRLCVANAYVASGLAMCLNSKGQPRPLMRPQCASDGRCAHYSQEILKGVV